ncbi:MAG: HlyC/CorC family transporter [Gammaproteobacteria bacterium]
MSHFQITVIAIVLAFLIILSGFFSAAETGLMAINRYRLRHKARMKKRDAMLILKLLKRPDRLLGMILIGNNCSNICASALATVLAIQLFGDKAVIISTVLLTLAVLIFSEVAPKTLAALYPERISRWVAWPVYGMLLIFYPFVWLLNGVSNGLLRLFGVKLTGNVHEPISREELRSVVYETSGRISPQYQNMLLGILDLNKVAVEDVMIPRHEVIGIDLADDWQVVSKQLTQSAHDWLPVYRENINQITGFLHLRDLMSEVLSGVLDKEKLIKVLHEPYFIPEGTPLNIQLLNFQRLRKRIALVVDEYGEIQGLVSVEDILEEIVGEFTTTVTTSGKIIEKQTDGSYLVDGAITIRELNRITQWKFPTTGPRTLNGLIIEYLEVIPRKGGVCVRIANYPVEILEVKENRVKVARIFPGVG